MPGRQVAEFRSTLWFVLALAQRLEQHRLRYHLAGSATGAGTGMHVASVRKEAPLGQWLRDQDADGCHGRTTLATKGDVRCPPLSAAVTALV